MEYIQERGGDIVRMENGKSGFFIPFSFEPEGSEDDEEQVSNNKTNNSIN
jgi:hypothetical protein